MKALWFIVLLIVSLLIASLLDYVFLWAGRQSPAALVGLVLAVIVVTVAIFRKKNVG